MEAQVTFVRKGKDRQWAPGFWVSLGNDEELARLSAVALPQSGPLILQTKRFADNQAEVLSVFALTPEFEEEFRLRIQWDNEGGVLFTVFSEAAQAVNGYESHTVQLKQPPSKLVIGGSTGEVIFNPLQLGTLPNS